MSDVSVDPSDLLVLATLRWFNDLSRQGIFTTDTGLTIRSWNRYLEDLTGQPAHAVIGRALFDVVPEIQSRSLECHYRDALAGESRVLAHRFHKYLIPGRPGEPEPAQSARITPLDVEGRIVGTLTVIDDVAERVASERELRNRIEAAETARAIAEDAVRVKDEFLATLSHEIRTPLNAVIGWTKILLGRQVDPQMLARALQVIDRNAVAQMRLIDDMLDMARIMSGKLRLEMQPVDLAVIARSAVDVVAPTAAAKGIALLTEITTDEPWLMGDADRLQQVTWNLLSNAIKFTDPGGRVFLSVSRTKEAVTLRVEDSGRGIEPEFLPQIFERFRQADPSSSRRHGGLGLGLSLVRTLTELHGGTITASSAPGAGSTFVVVFPGLAELIDTRSGVVVHSDVVARLKGLRVLIVEDDREAREIFVAVLQDYGVEVVEAASADEAIAAIEAGAAAGALPDTIISDIALPGHDGYRFIEMLTARPPSAGGSIPVIAVTAYGRPEDKRRALAAGFRLHLSKPVDPAAVAAALASINDRSSD